MNGMVGILAHGSLISSPGDEIEAVRSETRTGITTPFKVEFARRSQGRGGAPTLVPVHDGGAHVKGCIFVLSLPESEAADVLYRREVNKVSSSRRYIPPDRITENTVLVRRLTGFAGLDVVLYTNIAANIEPLTAQRLARLAIGSVKEAEPGRDGISYLIAAKQHGIRTALSSDYEAEILRQSRCSSLESALETHSR